MQTPANINWKADRYAAFDETVAFLDIDLTGASFAIQVRDRKDGGALRADLSTVTSDIQGIRLIYAGTDTLNNHIAAGRISQADAEAAAVELGIALTDSIALSEVAIRIDAATITAMPEPSELGDDNDDPVYDMKITPAGGTADVYVYGLFTVRAGVTQ